MYALIPVVFLVLLIAATLEYGRRLRQEWRNKAVDADDAAKKALLCLAYTAGLILSAFSALAVLGGLMKEMLR